MIDPEALALGCLNGDQRSITKTFDIYSKKFFYLAKSYAKSCDEANDIIQHSFIKVFDKISQYSFNNCFENWIYMIILNTAKSSYIKYKSKPPSIDIDGIDTLRHPSTVDNHCFDMEYIDSKIAKLSHKAKLTFIMHAVEGYKHIEIAKMLNIDIATSKSNYSRAKAKLRRSLKRFT